MLRLAWGIALALGVTATTPAAAEQVVPPPKLRVAIVPGIAVNLDAARVDALSQDLADAVAAELDVTALGGLEVRRRLPADGVPPDCVATPACVADVAARLDAEQLLFVVMVDTGAGGAIQIDSTWVEPASGKSASRPAIDLASVADAKARFTVMAPQLFPDAPVRPKPKAAPEFLGTMTEAVPRHFTLGAKLAGGVAVAGLGVGIGFGLRARSRYHACEDAPGTCSTDRHDTIRTSALVADLGYFVAIGGAVASAVMFATSGREARLVVGPPPDGNPGAAVTALGRF